MLDHRPVPHLRSSVLGLCRLGKCASSAGFSLSLSSALTILLLQLLLRDIHYTFPCYSAQTWWLGAELSRWPLCCSRQEAACSLLDGQDASLDKECTWRSTSQLWLFLLLLCSRAVERSLTPIRSPTATSSYCCHLPALSTLGRCCPLPVSPGLRSTLSFLDPPYSVAGASQPKGLQSMEDGICWL